VSEYVSTKRVGRKIDRNRKFSLFDAAAELPTPEDQAEFLKAARTYNRDGMGRVPASYLFHAMRTVMRARGMYPRRPTRVKVPK
jgi:DNA-binding phage protein